MTTNANVSAQAVTPGTTVWIVSWDGTVLTGNASTSMSSAKHNVAASTRTSQVTFQIYVPATDATSAQINAATYAVSAGFVLTGNPSSVINSGETVS